LNASAWPGGSWTAFYPTVPRPKASPASLCAGNRLWSVAGTLDSFVERITQYYDAGLMCNRSYPAVPWLTATPASASALAGNTSTITLGFNAAVGPYNTPGVYHAVLKFNSDAPYTLADIPVTMVVIKTNAALNVTPPSAFKMVGKGSYASYVFTLTNTSGLTDSFSVGSLEIGPGWTAVISPSSFTNLPNGGSAIINIKLYPPALGNIGDEGVVNLYAQVHDNSAKRTSFTAVATIQTNHVWLPVVIR
jgi:hypothetical protein